MNENKTNINCLVTLFATLEQVGDIMINNGLKKMYPNNKILFKLLIKLNL